ncbi:MAG TPA: NADH-quinone oxidoreductase subunit NuoF [Bacillota bacterium]|nr:NADH-quinone oxidoreductase subunit NuoF [Bacillota bacterium]
MGLYRSHVLVCGGAGCISSGCKAVQDELLKSLEANGLAGEIKVITTGCVGSCDLGPVLVIYPEGTFYQKVKPADVADIVSEHLLKGRPVERLLFHNAETAQKVTALNDIDFFNQQFRIALRNVGIINPDNIEEYIARDGYAALGKVLTEMTPEKVVDEIKRSGLRGRGGGGFPTGMKWEFTQKVENDQKYVVCNADEGDPGAFMDRSILEGDPHAVIEAMEIAGYAVGANQGFVYVRAEYPLAVEKLGHAIEQAREYGLLGKNIFGTDFSFDLEIRVGAGAFVCGEETAMFNSIMGHRGEPRPRPPFPAVKGLWDKPTLNNNVETYANVCPIILKGADWFSSIGTEKSKGTKVFAIAGKIKNTGLVEVPMGITLRQLVYGIGGGIPNGKKFKGAQIGGPSGGVLTEKMLDIPMDYDSLIAAGAMMGSGGLIIMDEDSCMVDMAKFFLEFIQDESCGKCTPCRIGTKRILEIVTRITEGKGRPEDLDLLKELATNVRATSLCGLGQTAPNPIMSMMKNFPEEYEAHIYEKRCPAGVCSALKHYRILPELCKGCGLCAKHCPEKIISGEIKKPHTIDESRCVKCGQCMEKCPFKAIEFK